MVQSQFSLSWDSYKSSICNGLSSLQQNGEFVDMTLAADGHFVKVHQLLVALASPYLKDLMTSAPCQHPVIFLNNVSYKNLCLLLEYIYTGETLVPSENLSSFSQAAKSLHIRGLEDIMSEDTQTYKTTTDMSAVEESPLCHLSGIKSIPTPSSCGIEINLPPSARKIHIKHDTNAKKIKELLKISPETPLQRLNCETMENNTVYIYQYRQRKRESSNLLAVREDLHEYSDMMDESGAQDDDLNFDNNTQTTAVLDSSLNSKDNTNVMFTVSIRGSLQIILNRYLYNLNATTARTGVRKWRCVDYRNNKCNAFVVTKGNMVVSRANPHNHSFHDKKILAKIEKKSVFSALDKAEHYKKTEDKEMESMTMDDNMISFEDFSDDLKLRSDTKHT